MMFFKVEQFFRKKEEEVFNETGVGRIICERRGGKNLFLGPQSFLGRSI